MAESIQFSVDFPVSTERVYRAWVDSYEHSQFTGRKARIEAKEGGQFSALDGEVHGQMLTLTPFSHIAQTWEKEGFPGGQEASRVDLKFEPTCTGAQVTLRHNGIPDGRSREVLESWEEYWFRPLLRYFEEIVGEYPADEGDG